MKLNGDLLTRLQNFGANVFLEKHIFRFFSFKLSRSRI